MWKNIEKFEVKRFRELKIVNGYTILWFFKIYITLFIFQFYINWIFRKHEKFLKEFSNSKFSPIVLFEEIYYSLF